MNALQWLDPVSAVRLRTGWTRRVCERFVGGLGGRLSRGWLIALLIGTLLVTLIAPPLLFVLLFYFLVPFLLFRHLVRGWRAPSALDRFIDEPWCLECRYPIPAVQGSADICPECGEPIPPEIAKLAAERADKSAS